MVRVFEGLGYYDSPGILSGVLCLKVIAAAIHTAADFWSSANVSLSLKVHARVGINHHRDAGSGINGSKEAIDRC